MSNIQVLVLCLLVSACSPAENPNTLKRLTKQEVFALVDECHRHDLSAHIQNGLFIHDGPWAVHCREAR